VLKFIRSVLPADLTQFIFLGGIVCLAIAPHLRWWPAPESSDIASWYRPELAQQSRAQWWNFLAVVIWLIHFASAAGFFICFWPGQRPLRRAYLCVLFPALLGITTISGRFIYLYLPRLSLFIRGVSRFSKNAEWSRVELWNLGPGFHACLLGIALILIFTTRLSLRLTSLPITLAPPAPPSDEDDASWKRTKILIFVVVTPLAFLPLFLIGISMLGFQTAGHSLDSSTLLYISFLQDVIFSFALIAIAIWISGAAGWQAIRRSLHWFNPIYLALSLAVPFGLGASFSVGRYLYDYIYWGAHNYGHFAPPAFTDYFSALHFNLLWLIFAALAEEIIYRALIQPKLIQRYGVWRGLFLVGIIWSAFHFYSDFHARMADLDVLLALGMRVFICLSLGFVLGWLTLRSGSIWPAVIAHASYNIILYSGFAFQFQGEEIVRIALWAILAFVLFRYWPVQIETPLEDLPPMSIEA
jgi:membrane protease YdiL (CAAX protease family)